MVLILMILITVLYTDTCIMMYLSLCPVSSNRYEPQGGIEAISPASSPAQREEKNEGAFPSEKNSQAASGGPETSNMDIQVLL